MSYQLYIVSADAGTLMYCRQSEAREADDQIQTAGYLHSMSQMANQICPVKVKCISGFTKIQTKNSVWTCFTSLTGLKIFLQTSNSAAEDAQSKLKEIYIAYCDYVLKNPFHISGQPIKAQKFEIAVKAVIDSIVQGQKKQ